MGYDMHWRNPRSDDDVELPAAELRFRAACDARDAQPRGSAVAVALQEHVDVAYRELSDAHRSYFRLNISGMCWARECMAERGMLCDAPSPDDEWPDYVEEGEPGYEEYRRIKDALLSRHDGECPGIPAYKLGSNDGWIVLPAEINAALRANEGSEPPAEYADLWARWITWMRDAIERGGFEVH